MQKETLDIFFLDKLFFSNFMIYNSLLECRNDGLKRFL